MRAHFPVLILGGTSEASQLAERLAAEPAFAPMMSFAGRTASPQQQPIPHRTGGFGGVEGLAAYLRQEKFGAVIDATHPFAARISPNAVAACQATGIPLAVLSRPPWQRVTNDYWIEVRDVAAAAAALRRGSATVFLAIGRQELAAFRDASNNRYVVRTVDPVPDNVLPVGTKHLTARGPFLRRDELTVLNDYAIEIVVAKNSGGDATYGKIAAARDLGLPVIMIQRPTVPAGGTATNSFTSIDNVMGWLNAVAERSHGTAS